jgi:hypothetical protein
VKPGQVSAKTRRTCVVIAVTGSLLVMAGLMLGFATQVVPGGLPGAGLIAAGLIAGGMFCGIILIAASGPPSRRGGRPRRAAPPGPAPAAMSGQPGTSEEWIRALRPGPEDRRRRRG